MKLVILYRPQSDHATSIETYLADLKRLHRDLEVEKMNLDTKDGAHYAKLYDVVRYPAILALGPDGQPLQVWQGETLPLFNDVLAYA